MFCQHNKKTLYIIVNETYLRIIEMYLNNLIIEVTRRCNMKCEHCLRGNAQKKDININDVDTLFSKINGIGELTISGGEPSLVPNLIDDIVALAKSRRVEIGNFYIATNAKKVTKEFICSIIGLYAYCSDNEISAVNWSNDFYHDDINIEQIKLLRTLTFAYPKNSDDNAKYSLIRQGRAKDFGDRLVNDFSDSYEIDEYGNIEGEIYLNCDGNLIAGCNYSYEEQDDNIICSVEELTLKRLAKELCIEIGVEVGV
jgi:hypothetical protein